MSPQTDATQPTTVSQAACRSAWARLIAKVYEVDPMLCPRCRSQMKLIAVITEPLHVLGVLRHLARTGKPPPSLDPASLH